MSQRSNRGENDQSTGTPANQSGRAGDAADAGRADEAAGASMGRGVLDRRSGLDRRLIAEMAAKLAKESREDDAAAVELDAQTADRASKAATSRFDDDEDGTGLERRRGPGRRRTDYTKAAEEGEMTQEQFLFISAVEAFKRSNNKMFPTWTDVLEVVRLLGYRKTMPSELNLRNVEDWTEKPTTSSGVRSKPGHPETRREAA